MSAKPIRRRHPMTRLSPEGRAALAEVMQGNTLRVGTKHRPESIAQIRASVRATLAKKARAS
jgi:hypothetical protein